MRIGVAGFYHESHAFGTPMTGLEQIDLVRGERYFTTYTGTRTSMGGVIDAAPDDWEMVPLVYATATPSGTITSAAYQQIRDELIQGVAAAHLDGIILILHGAMSVEGIEDAEGDLLEQVRSVLRRPKPLVVTVDLHANLSERMVALADLINGYKTYPHTDPYDRAVEATKLLARMLKGEVSPVAHLEKPPLLPPVQAQGTDRAPMRELITMAQEMERDPRVLNVTVTAGFPYGDEPRVGMGLLVTTDGNPELAARLAAQLRRYAWEHREAFCVENPSAQEAVAEAMASPEWPVVLVEVADNVGGGSAGDGTELLRELLAAEAEGALITINDPQAVQEAFRAGLGGRVSTMVGGKTDRLHGDPVPVVGQVIRLRADGLFRFVGSYMTGQPHDMGPAAVIRSGGVDIVLTSKRVMPFDVAYLQVLEIDPAAYRIIVAKSAIAWKAAFGDICQRSIEVDTPGITTVHLDRLPYQRLRRPLFPLDRL